MPPLVTAPQARQNVVGTSARLTRARSPQYPHCSLSSSENQSSRSRFVSRMFTAQLTPVQCAEQRAGWPIGRGGAKVPTADTESPRRTRSVSSWSRSAGAASRTSSRLPWGPPAREHATPLVPICLVTACDIGGGCCERIVSPMRLLDHLRTGRDVAPLEQDAWQRGF